MGEGDSQPSPSSDSGECSGPGLGTGSTGQRRHVWWSRAPPASGGTSRLCLSPSLFITPSIFVSSGCFASNDCIYSSRSLIKILNSVKPRADPCGTLTKTHFQWPATASPIQGCVGRSLALPHGALASGLGKDSMPGIGWCSSLPIPENGENQGVGVTISGSADNTVQPAPFCSRSHRIRARCITSLYWYLPRLLGKAPTLTHSTR